MIFLGIKYEPLSDPPSLKFVSGAPGPAVSDLFSCVFLILNQEHALSSRECEYNAHCADLCISITGW